MIPNLLPDTFFQPRGRVLAVVNIKWAVLHKVKTLTAAGIKTCHCDSKRVYAEINNDGEKFGKREMRENKNPAGREPCGTRGAKCES